MYNERKDTFDIKSVILQFLFVALFIFILVWLFPLKSDLKKAVKEVGSNDSTSTADLTLFYDRIFNENVISMKDAAKSYFTTSRLPQNVGDKVKMTLGEMLDKKIILPFVDSEGKQCNLDDSYVEITKNDDEFVMKVNLKCSDQENYLLVYMGCYDYCETAICEKNESDVKTPVVYSGKTNQAVQQTTTNNTPVNNDTPVYNKVVNNITNVVTTITKTDISVTQKVNVTITKKDPKPTVDKDPEPTPEPDQDSEPTPDPEPVKEYIYEYKKTETTEGTCSYSEWSAEQTTPITASSKLEVKVRTVKAKTLIGYNVTTGNDITKPIYETKEVGVGYEVKKYCKSYGYVNSENIGYGAWEFVGYYPVASNVTLRWTDTTRYVLVNTTDWLCKNQCTAGIHKVYKVYERKPINSSVYKCTEYGEIKTLITANQLVITGYEKKEISREPVYSTKTIKYYSSRTKDCTAGTKNYKTVWSTYNDRTLLDNDYVYTGNKKLKS